MLQLVAAETLSTLSTLILKLGTESFHVLMMVVEPQGLNFVEQKQNWQSYNTFLEKKNSVKEILNVITNCFDFIQ